MESGDEEGVFITCEVCDLPFTGIEPYEQHINGKKHKKRMREKKRQPEGGALELEDKKDDEVLDFTCDICKRAFSGIIPYTQHLRSKPHAKALRRKNAEEDPTRGDDVSSNFELPDNDIDLKDMIKEIAPEPFGCSICEMVFSGPESYYQHMKSKSHSKRKYELKLLNKIKAELSKSKDLLSSEICTDEEAQFAENDPALYEEQELECKECHKVFSGAISFAQHLTSKTHAKRQNRNRLLEELKNIKSEDDYTTLEDPESDGAPDDILDPVLTCDICNMAFSGPESAKAHLKSKGHQKAIKWKNYLQRKYKFIKQGKNTESDLAVKSSKLEISSNNVKSEKKTEKFEDDNNDTVERKDSDIGNMDAATYEKESFESALANCDEECSSYQETKIPVPSENMMAQENFHDFCSIDVGNNSNFLYPHLSADDQEILQNFAEEEESSVSENRKSGDKDANASSKGSNDDALSSSDTFSDKK